MLSQDIRIALYCYKVAGDVKYLYKSKITPIAQLALFLAQFYFDCLTSFL